MSEEPIGDSGPADQSANGQNVAHQVTSCGVLVYRDAPRRSFLLMKHRNRWDIPKGHVDPGETELECALRELDEETGIARDAIELDGSFRYVTQYVVREKRFGGEPAVKTLIVFLGRLTKKVKIRPTEHPDYAWFDWEPPHVIQSFTIDPLLSAVEAHWKTA